MHKLSSLKTALWGSLLMLILLMYSNTSLAMLCKNDQSGEIFKSGDTSFYIKLNPVIQNNQRVSVVNLRNYVACLNEDSTGIDHDYIRIKAGTGFSPSLDAKTFGYLSFMSNTLPLPLKSDFSSTQTISDYGFWTPIEADLYLLPEPGKFGKIIHGGDLVATVYVNKTSKLGGREDFSWRFFAVDDVYVRTGTCRVSSNNVNVTLPPYPTDKTVAIPLSVSCDNNQLVQYTLSGTTTGFGYVFTNTAASSPAKGIGIEISDNVGLIASGRKRRLGYVSTSPVGMGLKAGYVLTDGSTPTPGQVQAIINVTFEYT